MDKILLDKTNVENARRLTEFGKSYIESERQRAVDKYGFTVEHDLKHRFDRQLYVAAICYIVALPHPHALVPHDWPFETQWWKPSTRLINLIKAGGLMFAYYNMLCKQREVFTIELIKFKIDLEISAVVGQLDFLSYNIGLLKTQEILDQDRHEVIQDC